MRKYILNLFRLTNLHELNFSYKLVATDLRLMPGKEDVFNKHLRKVGERVSSLVGGPVAVVKRNGQWLIAIPHDRKIEDSRVDVGPFAVTIRELEGVFYIQSTEIYQDGNISIVKNFLDFEIRKQLGKNKDIWKLTNSHFLYRQPLRSSDDSSIEIYGGFSYRLVFWNGNMYICLNLTTKYIDKHYLTRYVNARNVDVLLKKLFGRKVVYQNGDDWYAAEIQAFGNSIKDHNFNYDGEITNVFDFISKKTKNHVFKTAPLLKEDHLALLYTYPGRSMEPHNGASSLARLVLGPQDREVKALHKFSIKDPSRRFEGIVDSIRTYFQRLSFNNKSLKINSFAEEELIQTFKAPGLLYNGGRILKPGHYSKGGNVHLREFGLERKQFLEDTGILNDSDFDEQWLIVPDYMDRPLVEAFKKNVEHQLKKLAPKFTELKVVRFKAKEGISSTFQIQEIEKALKEKNATSGFALFVIPDLGRDGKRSASIFHDCLKSKFYPALKVQCASADKIIGFFQPFEETLDKGVSGYKVPEGFKPKFRSYLFNLVMEHLIMNRKWPYALEKNLHYDIYIGIDVHGRNAGFTFFFKNGENQVFIPIPVPKRASGKRYEKLKAELIFKCLFENLKQYIPRFASNPNGIVIIRDGRSYGEEQKALLQVIEALAKEGLVNKATLKHGIVDLYKQSSIPFRIAAKTDSFSRLENPVVGSYKIVNTKEGFLFITGFPFQLRGTAKPQHLSLQSGNVDFLKIMEDVFCQTMLAYSAPDRSNSLPVTIKLIDTLLKPLTAMSEVVEEDEEEMEEPDFDKP
jgi:hypothetical protein